MLTRLFGIPVLCLIGQNVIAEGQVAQDITADIEDADLEYAQQLVNDCAGGKAVAPMSEYGAYSWQGQQTLGIQYDWHENTATRKARYSAEFERETASEPWKLFEIGVTGEQTIAGQDQPIHFNGYVDSKTLEELTTYVRRMWNASTSAPFAIGGIITNQEPPMHCGASSSETGPVDIVYEVSLKNLSPRILPTPVPEPNTLVVASSGTTDHTYNVRVVHESRGRFRTTDVNCASSEGCDPELLARLRATLDQSAYSIEVEKRLQDALAALPARFRGAHVLSTQYMMLGASELFNVEFAETAVSPSRKEASSVRCFRTTGTRDNWTCQHIVHQVRQQVPGQSRLIDMLEPIFNESELEQIVLELRSQFAAHPDVGVTDSDIQILDIIREDDRFGCTFLRGDEIWSGVFTYDDNVKLESVELLARMNAGQ